jgi:hypothetical protein
MPCPRRAVPTAGMNFTLQIGGEDEHLHASQAGFDENACNRSVEENRVCAGRKAARLPRPISLRDRERHPG